MPRRRRVQFTAGPSLDSARGSSFPLQDGSARKAFGAQLSDKLGAVRPEVGKKIRIGVERGFVQACNRPLTRVEQLPQPLGIVHSVSVALPGDAKPSRSRATRRTLPRLAGRRVRETKVDGARLPREASPTEIAKDGQHNNDDENDPKPGRHVILSLEERGDSTASRPAPQRARPTPILSSPSRRKGSERPTTTPRVATSRPPAPRSPDFRLRPRRRIRHPVPELRVMHERRHHPTRLVRRHHLVRVSGPPPPGRLHMASRTPRRQTVLATPVATKQAVPLPSPAVCADLHVPPLRNSPICRLNRAGFDS